VADLTNGKLKYFIALGFLSTVHKLSNRINYRLGTGGGGPRPGTGGGTGPRAGGGGGIPRLDAAAAAPAGGGGGRLVGVPGSVGVASPDIEGGIGGGATSGGGRDSSSLAGLVPNSSSEEESSSSSVSSSLGGGAWPGMVCSTPLTQAFPDSTKGS